MTVKITKEIRDALDALISDWGSALEVERRLGVTNSTISKYRSGKIPRMGQSTWKVLEPHLRGYLSHHATEKISPPEDGTELEQQVLQKFIRVIADSSELSDTERGKFIRLLTSAFPSRSSNMQ